MKMFRTFVHFKFLPVLLLASLPTISRAVIFNSSTSIASGDTNYDGQPVIVSGCTLTVDGAHNFASLLLTNGATLTHTPAYNGEPTNQINLTIAGDCVVTSNSGINADGRGYANGTGPGAGASDVYYGGSGGGHGGAGGAIYGNYYYGPGGVIYGSIVQPGEPGSGGGTGNPYFGYHYGGYGGGVVHLIVGGSLQVDGAISVTGGAGHGAADQGGGAGGSIWIETQKFSGGGSLNADGGYGGGGGGGGRIAIYSITDNFSGVVSAVGGSGGSSSRFGNPGTIYRKVAGAVPANLIWDNAGRLGVAGLTTGETNLENTRLVLSAATLTLDGQHNLAGLLLTNGAMLTHTPASNGETNNQINLTITGDCLISSNSSVNADSAGYAHDAGPGLGGSGGYGGGGAHGGDGGYGQPGYGSAGGTGYDSITMPSLPGSGGANGGVGNDGSLGGAGGGVIILNVTGGLQVDGRVTARGGNETGFVIAGGGAGGSIRLTAENFSGNGYIGADGGNGAYGGAGGGGRIAIYSAANNFSGSISAIGGFGTRGQKGGAGTSYQKRNSNLNSLTIDNQGYSGAITRLTNAVPDFTGLVDLRVLNYAVVEADAPLGFFGLMMTNHARVIPAALLAPINLTLSGNALVDATSAIDASGYGWSSGSGPGAGGGNYGGGGGHAGAGGWGWNSAAAGGATNGDFTTPGSGGGGSFNGPGGYGGGTIHFEAVGNLNLEGTLGANGNNGGAGGGSGGGIFLRAGSFFGHGSVAANGADAGPYAGGGGGGFLDVGISDTNYFEGALTANGGVRGHYTANDGGPGQVVFQSSGVPTNYFLGQFPSGVLTRPVSSVTFALTGGPHFPAATDFELVIPSGVLSGNQLSLTNDGNFLTLSFPAQTAAGDYAVRLPANPRTPGTSNYVTANFSIAWPHVSGTVTFTNGWPLAGVPVGSSVTAHDGSFSFFAPPGSSSAFAPVIYGSCTPAQRSYANILGDLGGQNFSVSDALNPTLASSLTNSGNTAHLEWNAIAGLRYQLERSGDLLNWQDYGVTQDSVTNFLDFNFPVTNLPTQFFRVRVFSY